jgi:spermidine/putrescine transport system substrate-binding protein
MKTLLIRISVVIFWVALILGILYWPKSDLPPLGENSINVFAWGDILEPSVITQFEKETGVTVRVNYYASNEELIVKIKATGGEGYDLIIPSDYSVEILAKDNLLKKIDHSKLNFWNELNPMLLNHSFDPGNVYSIPFSWELFVLGIDKTYFQNHPLDPSWKMIFDPRVVDYRVAMINDPVEAILIASFYLYGPVETLTPEQMNGIVDLLTLQKTWVVAYADFRADYFLATKNCPVALATSSYILRTMRKFPFVDFVVPKEGSFVSIENIAIPKASKKEHLVYKLINYLYTPESMATHFKTYGIFPATKNATSHLEADERTRNLIDTSSSQFSNFQFTRLITSQENIRNAWVQIKSSD